MLSLQLALFIESSGNLSCWIQVRKFWRNWRCHAGFRKTSELEQSSGICLCMSDGHERGRTCQMDSIDLRECQELNLLKPPNSKQRKRKERKRRREREREGRRERERGRGREGGRERKGDSVCVCSANLQGVRKFPWIHLSSHSDTPVYMRAQ